MNQEKIRWTNTLSQNLIKSAKVVFNEGTGFWCKNGHLRSTDPNFRFVVCDRPIKVVNEQRLQELKEHYEEEDFSDYFLDQHSIFDTVNCSSTEYSWEFQKGFVQDEYSPEIIEFWDAFR